MVKDRSSEFRRKAKQFSSNDINDAPRMSETVDFFFNEIDEIRDVMARLADDVANMQLRQRAILAQTIVDNNEKEKLDECIAGIKHRSAQLRRYLIEMKRENENSERLKSVAVNRIKKHHIEALTKKLSDLLEIFNAAQLDYRAQVTKRIKRQLEIAGEYVTEEEINTMVDSTSPHIFNREVRSLELKSALDDASSRHNEIIKLEESIKELNDLYSELAFLVHSQGETIDRIDRNVSDAVDYMEAGKELGREALQYRQAELRKRLFCTIASVVIIVLLIIIIIIYIFNR